MNLQVTCVNLAVPEIATCDLLKPESITLRGGDGYCCDAAFF